MIGAVLITTMMAKFIDSPVFQRLRSIKQLGTTYYVWAGASHNRFEHCIGTRLLFIIFALQRSQPELRITDRDVQCVTLAGLCHDLGHGPWSHVWDGVFIPHVLPNSKWTHEEGSEMMLDFLIAQKKIVIPPKDVVFIKALIAGDHDRCKTEKAFLFDIVANKRNGLDVDKLDYIQRDSLAIGDPIKLQVSRLIESARVIEKQICYEYKDLDKVFEVFQTRHKLHKNFYNHKTAKAIEYMIVDALMLAEPYLNIAERIKDPKEFLWLTDDLMQEIQKSRDPCVDKKWVKWEERHTYKQLVTPQRIWECAREAYDQLSDEERVDMDAGWAEDDLSFDNLTVNDIKVEHSTLHYGMKEKNPIDKVKFYSKLNPNQVHTANDGDYSTLRPFVFAEVLLRVFTKKKQFHGIIQAGYRRIPDLDTPQSAPSTVDVEVAEGGKPIEANTDTSSMPPTVDSDVPMSPPVTERGLPDDGASSDNNNPTEPSSSQPLSTQSLSRHITASMMNLDRTPSGAISTAATAGSLVPSPKIASTSPSFVTPGASSSPRISAPTPRITTENRFLTVDKNHGSPIKPRSKKRDRTHDDHGKDEVAVGDRPVSPGRVTRSASRVEPKLPGDREVSPSPVPRKVPRHG
ncbi:hypothetical protein BT96DRAFT_987093 [Gymnopus androsaceus JB14]|uniref:HD/PDEase domain-containing protein n=1 Tax=Gymnopus androsaceus JB14 TaxID=1447944 RepID=A0A6A4IDE9_9AGAR|nr:hypothetical protein BT96DRAFT_987093 [Gymnopus androsaceus JB14]